MEPTMVSESKGQVWENLMMQNRSMIGIGSKAKKLRDDRQRSAFAVAQAVKQMEALTWIGLAMGQGLRA